MKLPLLIVLIAASGLVGCQSTPYRDLYKHGLRATTYARSRTLSRSGYHVTRVLPSVGWAKAVYRGEPPVPATRMAWTHYPMRFKSSDTYPYYGGRRFSSFVTGYYGSR